MLKWPSTGKSLGIEFNYDKVLMTPNTLAGHRLLWWAEQQNHQDHLAEALFRAYFTEGRDVGRHDVLAEIAAEVGLPQAEAMGVSGQRRRQKRGGGGRIEGTQAWTAGGSLLRRQRCAGVLGSTNASKRSLKCFSKP